MFRAENSESESSSPSYSTLEAMLTELRSYIEQGYRPEPRPDEVSSSSDEESNSEEDSNQEESDSEESTPFVPLQPLRRPDRWFVEITAGRGTYNFNFDYNNSSSNCNSCGRHSEEESSSSSEAPRYADSESLRRDLETLRSFFDNYRTPRDNLRFEYTINSNGGLPSLRVEVAYTASCRVSPEEEFVDEMRGYCKIFTGFLVAGLGLMPLAMVAGRQSLDTYLLYSC